MNIYNIVKNYNKPQQIQKEQHEQIANIWMTSNYYFEKSLPILKNIFETTSNDEFLNEVNKLLSNFSKNTFNDKIESLAFNYATNRGEFEKRKFNYRIYYILFKTYPYFIYFIMYMKTIKEQKKFVNEMDKLDKMYNITIAGYTQNMEKYKNYLDNYEKNYNTNSTLINFNNFIGIIFDKVNITYDKLPQDCLIVHAGFNNTFKNVTYNAYEGLKTNFMTFKDVLDFQTINQIKTINVNKCWEYKNENSKSKNCYICICYDNDTDLKKCIYSISMNYITPKNMEVLLNGGIIWNVPKKTFELYMSKMFYIRRNMLFDVIDNSGNEETATQILKAKLAKAIKNCYNTDYSITADKMASQFPDEKYLRMYLEGLKMCCDENGILEYNKYYEYVKIYFFPTNI